MTWLTAVTDICITNDHGYVLFIVIKVRSFTQSWLTSGIVTIVTRLVPLVEQEMFTLTEHLCLPPVFNGVCVIQSLGCFLCSVLYTIVCTFVLFLLAIVLSPLLWCMVSDYVFGIFDVRPLITPLASLNLSYFYCLSTLYPVICWGIVINMLCFMLWYNSRWFISPDCIVYIDR